MRDMLIARPLHAFVDWAPKGLWIMRHEEGARILTRLIRQIRPTADRRKLYAKKISQFPGLEGLSELKFDHHKLIIKK
jgi:hypothetical protein